MDVHARYGIHLNIHTNAMKKEVCGHSFQNQMCFEVTKQRCEAIYIEWWLKIVFPSLPSSFNIFTVVIN